MAVKLDRLLRDLRGNDDDMKVLALTTLCQHDFSSFETQKDALLVIRDELLKTAGQQKGELGFLYRQTIERINESGFVASLGEAAAIDLSGLRSSKANEVIACLLAVKGGKDRRAVPMVKQLIQATRHERVLATALSCLGRLVQSADEVETFKPYLAHGDGRVRANAADAVAHLASQGEAVVLLAPMLRDKNKRARTCALRIVGKLGRDGVLRIVDEMLDNPDVNRRAKALYVLENLRGDEVVERVVKAARDPSEFIRLEAVSALERWSEPRARQVLEELAERDENETVRDYAKESLRKMTQALDMTSPGLDMGLIDLAQEESKSPLDLEALTGEDMRAQVHCMRRIEQRGFEAAYPYVLDILKTAVDPELVCAGLSALSVIGSGQDLKVFQQSLRSPDPNIRCAAVDGIEQVGTRREIMTWLTPVLVDGSDQVRIAAKRSLERLGEGPVTAHLKRMLASPHAPVKMSAVAAMASLDFPVVREIARQMAGHPDEELRAHLARSFNREATPWRMQLLGHLAQNDPAASVKEAAQESLRRLSRQSVAFRREEARTVVVEQEQPQIVTPELEPSEDSTEEGGEGEGAEKKESPKVGLAERLQALSKMDVGQTLTTFIGKLSPKKQGALKELGELDKKRSAIFEAMGRRIFELMEKRAIDHKGFRNTYYVIQKYLHLREAKAKERKKASDEPKSIWSISGISRMLGAEDPSEKRADDYADQLRIQYTALGRDAHRLLKRGERFEDLEEFYLDLEQLEHKMENVADEGEEPS